MRGADHLTQLRIFPSASGLSAEATGVCSWGDCGWGIQPLNMDGNTAVGKWAPRNEPAEQKGERTVVLRMRAAGDEMNVQVTNTFSSPNKQNKFHGTFVRVR